MLCFGARLKKWLKRHGGGLTKCDAAWPAANGYRSVTSSAAMIGHRAKSLPCHVDRKPGMVSPPGKTAKVATLTTPGPPASSTSVPTRHPSRCHLSFKRLDR